MSETFAAKLLALLTVWYAFLWDRLDLEWPAWAIKDGKSAEGELVGVDWPERAILVQTQSSTGESGGALWSIRAEELDLASKVRMLCSEVYQDNLANNLEELEATSGWADGLQRLSRLGLVWVAGVTFCLLAVNWILAGSLLKNGAISKWLASVAGFLVLTAAAGASVFYLVKRFGDHQMLEYLVLAAVFHTVIFLILIWLIYRVNPFRTVIWYAFCWGSAALLPVTLLGTAVAAQVYGHAEALDMAAFDLYLSEVWLEPMGLL